MSDPAEAEDLKLLVDGLCHMIESRPEFLAALQRQLRRRSPKPEAPAELADQPAEITPATVSPYAEIKMTLEAILLPKYDGLDKSLWMKRLVDLEAAHPELVENVRQHVLWEASSSKGPKPLVPAGKAIHLVLEEMKLSDHSKSAPLAVDSHDEKKAG